METGKGFLTSARLPTLAAAGALANSHGARPCTTLLWESLGAGGLVTSEHREALARPGSDSK